MLDWTTIGTHAAAFLVGAFTGAAGQYLADRFTDQRRRQEASADAQKRFDRAHEAMPECIARLKSSIEHAPLVREFVLLPKGAMYNSQTPIFRIPDDDMPAKVGLLEDAGYVHNVATAHVAVLPV